MRSYLKILLGVSCSLLFVFAAFCAVVDPYRITDLHWLSRYAAIKPRLGDHVMLSKPIAVWRRQPSALILGSSRENHGLDPMHAGWSVPPDKRYNLGKDEGNIVDSAQLFEHALQVSTIKQAVLGLEFLNMFDAQAIRDSDLDVDLLAAADHPTVFAVMSTNRYFLSPTTFMDSVYTLRHQQPGLDEFEPDGRRNEVIFERAVKKAGSQRKMFLFSEWSNYIKSRHALGHADRLHQHLGDGTATISYLGRILDLAVAYNVDLRIVITPIHARQIETYRALGLFADFEQWKHNVLLVAQGRQYRTTQRVFPVWDFADYNSITTESVPTAGDRITRMQWYWESSHFKKATGNLLLDRVFGCDCSGQAMPADFGVLLTPDGLDSHLNAVRVRAENYRADHPADIGEIEQMVATGHLP